jgi:hypothetical protein
MGDKVKVYAPNRAYTGNVGNDPENQAKFEAGVAEVASDSPLLRYFREAGYGIGKRPEDRDEDAEDQVDWPDPRSHRVETGMLRDAAVDPVPSDYLAPINAGEAHPRSSKVVSPGIHGVAPAPIRPGEVFVDDVARQEVEEKRLAERVLVDRDPATIIESDEGPGGPLGLSDPGSVEMGERGAVEVRKAEAEAARAAEDATPAAAVTQAPGKGARKAEWVSYAVSQGMARDEAEDLSIPKLQERFG